MEGNLSSGNINIGGNTYGGLDLQSPIRPHHRQHQPLSLNQQHQPIFRPILENFPLTMSNCDRTMSLSDFSKGEKGKSSASEDDELSIDTVDEGNKGKKGVQWQRVKWTDKMVRLLITAVSYIGEDVNENGNNSRKRCVNSQKKGKWKSISKAMSERGHSVSPQQCEDKFNDLNKRYKRLNEILGRGTSCQVVEKPELLEVMPNLSKKGKDEVKKILSSKQLFYEEMCSYHNKNRLRLPHDPELQHSLRSALRIRDDHENGDLFEDDHDAEGEDHGEFEGNSAKKLKPCLGHGGVSLENSIVFPYFDKNTNFQSVEADTNIEHRSLQLEEQRLEIQAQKLELDRERFKWERFCRREDRELEMMKVENEKMKLENERMAMELKKMEMGIDIN